MKIEHNGILLGIIVKSQDWKEGLDFFTSNDDFIQVGTWNYQNKVLKAHEHIINKREISKTQEIIVVLEGEVLVDFYFDKSIVKKEVVRKGEFAIFLNGGHGYQIPNIKTKVIEVKNGPFISVEKDKILI